MFTREQPIMNDIDTSSAAIDAVGLDMLTTVLGLTLLLIFVVSGYAVHHIPIGKKDIEKLRAIKKIFGKHDV